MGEAPWANDGGPRGERRIYLMQCDAGRAHLGHTLGREEQEVLGAWRPVVFLLCSGEGRSSYRECVSRYLQYVPRSLSSVPALLLGERLPSSTASASEVLRQRCSALYHPWNDPWNSCTHTRLVSFSIARNRLVLLVSSSSVSVISLSSSLRNRPRVHVGSHLK